MHTGYSGVVLQLGGQLQEHSSWTSQPQHLGTRETIAKEVRKVQGLHTHLVYFKVQSLVVVFICTIYAPVYILEWDLLIKASENRTYPKTKHTFWFLAEQSRELEWKKFSLKCNWSNTILPIPTSYQGLLSFPIWWPGNAIAAAHFVHKVPLWHK